MSKQRIKKLVNDFLLRSLDLKLYSTRAFGRDITLDIKRIIGQPEIMFDVGANVGQTVDLWTREFKQAEIHSFEPVKRLYQALHQNCSARAVCNHLGVGDTNEKIMIHYGKHDVSHSFVHDDVGKGGEITQLVTLDSYSKDKNIDHIDVLKLDVEGYENNVIDGASMLLNNKRIDIIEAELGFDQSGYYTFYSDFADKLSKFGYHPLGFYDQTTHYNGAARLLFCNVLFALEGLSFEN